MKKKSILAESEEIIEDINKSIEELSKRKLPNIIDIRDLSTFTGIDDSTISSMIHSTENFYREFKLKKRRGGFRTISVPYPSLLFIQRWIYDNILGKYNSNESAHGFIKNKSILSNARVHLENTRILKTDIKDFFPSISLKRVIGIFRGIGYTKKISYFLGKLCTYNGSLPQGAATSPVISNIISFRLDNRLRKLAESFNLIYSRYSDDLTFSGTHIPVLYINIIVKILKQEGFVMNKKKTKMITGNGKKIITGVSINNHRLSLPRENKRAIRKDGYYCLKYKQKTLLILKEDPFYLERILGRIGFWLFIEPENKYANYLHKNILKFRAEF